MATEEEKQRRNNLLRSVGRRGLQAIFPNDFEVYFTALELVDSNDKIVEYFAFPLNPNQINESEAQITKVQKTNAGITTFSTSTFVPVNININGNFGRRFKALYQPKQNATIFSGVNYTEEVTARIGGLDFNSFIKTGYGCIKLLDKIAKLSNQLDDRGNPMKLFFYNLSLGNAYIVNIDSISFTQSMESNMIWNYNLSMTAVAPLSQVKSVGETAVVGLTTSAIQNVGKSAASFVKSLIV